MPIGLQTAFALVLVVCAALVGCAGASHAVAEERAPEALKNPADLRRLELALIDLRYDGFSLEGVALLHATDRVELLQILNFKTLQVRGLSQCDGPAIDVFGPDFAAGTRNLSTIVLKKDEYYGKRFSELIFSPRIQPNGGPDCIVFRLTYTPTGDFLSQDILNYEGKALKSKIHTDNR